MSPEAAAQAKISCICCDKQALSQSIKSTTICGLPKVMQNSIQFRKLRYNLWTLATIVDLSRPLQLKRLLIRAQNPAHRSLWARRGHRLIAHFCRSAGRSGCSHRGRQVPGAQLQGSASFGSGNQCPPGRYLRLCCLPYGTLHHCSVFSPQEREEIHSKAQDAAAILTAEQ